MELRPPGGRSTDHLSGHSTPSEEAAKIQMQLRLLENEPPQLPRWMNHYRTASYVIYSIIALYSFFYLVFIGIHQANPRFQIQYSTIVRYLEYNSYSILSPLLCPVLMCIFMYQVKYRIKLDEGDFFGVLGLLLFLALLNVHDCWGIVKILKWDKYHDTKNKTHITPPPNDETSRNDLHWQYAWSTRTVCARKYLRDLHYQYEYSRKHVVRQILFQTPRPHTLRQLTVDPNAIQCNKFHDIKSRAKIRSWMADIQHEFKCCGPYGYKEWKEWFDNAASTKCNKKWIDKKTGDIQSCFEPVVRWLDKIMVATCWIMITQAIFYFIAMFLAGLKNLYLCIQIPWSLRFYSVLFLVNINKCLLFENIRRLHHSAMKFETRKVEKRCSLLSMTDTFVVINPKQQWLSISRPADKPVIVGEYPPKPDVLENEDENGLSGSAKQYDKISSNSSESGRPSKWTNWHKKRKLRGIAELMSTLNRLGTLKGHHHKHDKPQPPAP